MKRGLILIQLLIMIALVFAVLFFAGITCIRHPTSPMCVSGRDVTPHSYFIP